jgi:hypothetical protein
MRCKKGSHVGMVLSFVIFVTFIIFLYSVVEPSLKTTEDKKDELKILEVDFLEKISNNLVILTITNESQRVAGKDCLRVNISKFKGMGEIIVKDVNGIPVESRSSGDNVFLKWGGQDIFKIYISPSLGGGGTFTGDCQEGVIKVSKDKSQIFNESIEDLFLEYESSYDALKKSLNVGANSNFGFGVGDRDVPEDFKTKQNIYAKELVIEIMDSTANINPGFVRIKVW